MESVRAVEPEGTDDPGKMSHPPVTFRGMLSAVSRHRAETAIRRAAAAGEGPWAALDAYRAKAAVVAPGVSEGGKPSSFRSSPRSLALPPLAVPARRRRNRKGANSADIVSGLIS